ncbi:hypothetical protein EDC94DRAFT_56452 [Helicostylum pulchrum]|uniref:Uncharacterized protein n=1 Tax=Helicostylum pulchrum TaxID=562976 RepID=A0ABP9XKS6_9FUNG|nr:hypothetical protein EDC94DRAFT_56452 [Helicostylum pulchrum]
MSQPEKTQGSLETVFDFILIKSNQDKNIQKAIGIYKNEEEAYAAAVLLQMQTIEDSSDSWSKSILIEKQEQIIELCRSVKEDFTTYKERFNYMSTRCNQLFQGLYDSCYQVLPLFMDNAIPPNSLNESVFKTKVRNFLDAFLTKSDIEEDLGNSDGEDDEEEEDLEEDLEEEEDDIEEEEDDIEEEEEEDDIEEDDIEEGVEEEEEEGVEEDVEEEEEEDECPTSDLVMPELDSSEDELEENTLKRTPSALEEEDEVEEDEESALKINPSTLEEEDEEEDDEENTLKRKASGLEEDDDEEDELDDEEETATVKRRRVIVS